MESGKYQQLAEIARKLEPDYARQKNEWANSPFNWMVGLPSASKGAAGKQLARSFIAQKDFAVSGGQGEYSDISVNGREIKIKFSTLWDAGVYKFQQIQKQNYDILLCLGISPHAAHSWVVRKSDIVWEDMVHQHGGRRGTDTWWISFSPPHCPHAWMRPQSGDLSEMIEELRKLTGN